MRIVIQNLVAIVLQTDSCPSLRWHRIFYKQPHIENGCVSTISGMFRRMASGLHALTFRFISKYLVFIWSVYVRTLMYNMQIRYRWCILLERREARAFIRIINVRKSTRNAVTSENDLIDGAFTSPRERNFITLRSSPRDNSARKSGYVVCFKKRKEISLRRWLDIDLTLKARLRLLSLNLSLNR